MGCGILATYPEVATIAGVQGLVVYAVSSSLPMLMFAFLGPIIRRRCPDGFVLTEWVRERYGIVTALYLSFFTIATMVSRFFFFFCSLSGIGALTLLLSFCTWLLNCQLSSLLSVL